MLGAADRGSDRPLGHDTMLPLSRKGSNPLSLGTTLTRDKSTLKRHA